VNVAFPRFLYLSAVLHLVGFGLIFYGALSREVRTFPNIYSVRIMEEPVPLISPPETIAREQIRPRIPDVSGKTEMPSKERMIKEESPAPPAEPPLVKEEMSVSDTLEPSETEVPAVAEGPSSEGAVNSEESHTLSGRKRIFDRNILRMIAQAEKRPPEKEGITFDTKEYKYRNYMQRLKETVEGIWIYPRGAAEKGIYGDLFIRFVIKKDGKLGEVKVIRTSGHRALDSAAIKALRDAEPFWPLPDAWEINALTVTGHFIYTIHGMEIR
jgi:TonB family protein